MGNIKVMQVVGFKNSGKTTLMNRFIELARMSDKKVSAIKHHGHGGKPELPLATTDSMRFLENGAASSLVYGDGMVQVHIQEMEEDLTKFIGFSQLADPDFILIEGFKGASHPKIVIVRNLADWQSLKELKNILLVIAHKDVELEDADWMESGNQAAIDRFFREWMEGEEDESI